MDMVFDVLMWRIHSGMQCGCRKRGDLCTH